MAEIHTPDPKNPEAVADLTGTSVGRFVIRTRLGGGAMGEVYRADDTKLKRPVALKRIAPEHRADEQYRVRFLKEAERASRLSSDRIAGVYDVLEENGEVFLVMEYVEGQTLRERLRKPLATEEFLRLAVQCAEALVAAHEKDIVHRDIKPENIMLTPAGQVKVLDFGVAKRLARPDPEAPTTDFSSTEVKGRSGTPAYMAPETWRGREVDERVDIFSLGVVFYEALSGRHPFRAGSYEETVARILHEEPAPVSSRNPQVPAELDRVVAKMLAKDPAERYATARDLLGDLRRLQEQMVEPDTGTEPDRRGWRRWQAVGLPAAALVAIVVAIVATAAPSIYRLVESVLWPIPDQKNVVVLQFEAIGGTPEDQAYAGGLMQTVTAKLTTLTDTHNLQVTPASDVIEKSVTSAEEAREQFGTNLAVQGSLHRVEATIRINCNLVDTAKRINLRSRTITEDASDFFGLEDRVVNAVLEMLMVEVEPKEQTVLAAHGTGDPVAHALYLRGQGYLRDYDKPENVESAIRNFKGALEVDRAYAPAHAGLGEAYWRKYESTKESHWVEAARQNCNRSLELSPGLAAAHICLGTVFSGTGRYQEAEGEFSRAAEAEPTSDAAYRGLALTQRRQGKLEQAEETYRRAISLRPHYWAGYDWLGAFYARELSRFEQAAELYEEARKKAPGNVRVHRNLGGAYTMMGRYQDAEAVFREALAIRPTSLAYSNLGVLYFHLRRFPDSAEMFEKAIELGSQQYIVWGNLARAYYWAPGLLEKAPAAFQRAVALGQEHLQVNPKDTDARILLAYYYAVLGERSQSLANLQQALQARPTNAEFFFWAAVIHDQFGEREQALEQLEQAIAGGYSLAELSTAVEFDNLRDDPRVRELIGSP